MKPAIILSLSLLALSSIASASGISTTERRFLRLTPSMTYASKYMTDGFNVGGDQAVMQPGVNVNIGRTNFSVLAWASLPVNRSQSEFDEIDLFARYWRNFAPESRFSFNLHGFVDFWFYPKNQAGQGKRQGNKLHAGVTLPRAFPLADSFLVPSYNAYYWISWAGNRRDRFQGGTRHELMLQYHRAIPAALSGQYGGLTTSISYNDGAFGVRPGLSHATTHLETVIPALGGNLSASLNYQWSLNETINPEDELWLTVSLAREF